MDQPTRSSSASTGRLLTSIIDYTNLKPNATRSDIEALCQQAIKQKFFSVCVNPIWVETAKKCLKHSLVKTCTVIGFPLGASVSLTKAFEATQAADADELDMVMNIGAAKEGQWNNVAQDIRLVVEVAQKRPVKVILETCLLTDEEIIRACEAAADSGAQFVKTSTGFSTGGATIEAIKIMRQSIPEAMGVKASGGIKTVAQAQAMVDAGATRIGTSAILSIQNG